MKSTFAAAAVLARLAVAAPAPAPQAFDFAAVLDAPTLSVTGPPVGAVSQAVSTLNTASFASSVSAQLSVATASVTGQAASAASTSQPTATAMAKRSETDECAPQPGGYGPHVEPDTVEAFENYPYFHAQAQSAITPKNYTNSFRDLNASVSQNSYLTYKVLQSYSVSDCASFCDNTNLCLGFNIYVERDPSVNPSNDESSNATYCPNPPSITNYKCSLFGSSVNASAATNNGQYRIDFHVVIAGSNGYSKAAVAPPPSLPGYSAPENCDGAAISAGGSYAMGSKFFPGPFNPLLCSIYAKAQNDKNKASAQATGKKSFTPVNSFNAYMVLKNGFAQGTYCVLFDTKLSTEYAAYTGGWASDSFFGVETSYTYALSVQLDGTI